MGVVAVLGGIWEIVSVRQSGPTELAWSGREGQPGNVRLHGNRKPAVPSHCDAFKRLTSARVLHVFFAPLYQVVHRTARPGL